MGTSAESAVRERDDPRSRRFSGCWSRWRPFTSLLLGVSVFVGLWLTVTPVSATARSAQFALGALAVAGVTICARVPVLSVVVTASATAIAWLVGVTADPFVVTGFAVFRLAESRGGRKFPWWMFAGVFVVLMTSMSVGAEGAEDRFRGMLLSALVLSVAWVTGVRTREVGDEAAARSRAEERLRLARDVHDVLSHSLGMIGIRAGVAAHVSTLGAEDLRDVLRGIEGDARSSLSELKDLLNRERAETSAEDLTASPLQAAIKGILQAAEGAGVTVHLDSDDDIDELPAVVRTTMLRVVQESVTNVVRHAAATSALLTIRVTSESATVEVADDGHGAQGVFNPGYGLAGMRERVELLGGTVDCVPSPCGFTVRVLLPLLVPRSDGGRR